MAAQKQLVIVGAGGFGREVLAWARQSFQYGVEWGIKGFVDDNLDALKGKSTPAPIIGRVADYQPQGEDIFICALGTPEKKRDCTEKLIGRGAQFTRLVHKTAIIGNNVELGEGVILCPYSVLSANNIIGRGVAINLHASVDHDACVGDWSQVSCHCDLTASVMVGREVFLGSSVSIIPGVKVGDGAYVGAGSVVVRDVPPGAKVYGVPAHRSGGT